MLDFFPVWLYNLIKDKEREVLKMTYLKSLSGQVYAVSEMPKFMEGYEVVSKEEFETWCKENGFTPKEMTIC